MSLQQDGPAPHPPLTSEQQAQVRTEQTRLLFTQLPLSVVVTATIAGILAFAMRGHVDHSTLLGWLAAMLGVCLARIALWHFWQRDGYREAAHLQWQARFEAAAFAAGCGWGAAPLFIFPADNLAHQVFMGFVLASIASGGISTLAVHLKSYVVFLLPTLLPYSIRLFIEGGELQLFMGLVFVLGLGFLLINARRFESVTVNALTLRHENQRLVDALRAALHDAEGANLAKTQFLANMSHEIRTPLSGMMGMAELLLKSELSSQQRRLAGTVNQSANSLLALVEDLLDVSRIESGSFALDERDLDLRGCIEDAIDLCAGAGYRKGLEIHLIIPQRLPLQVKGDLKRLHQVIVNLISSAIRFIEVGQITLRVTCELGEDRSYRLTCSIADNGIGIAHKELARQFEPLTRPISQPGARTPGADLSLSVTRYLLDMMGGTVSMSSEIGKGTVVTFALNLAPSTTQPDALEIEPAILSGKRVLVLDDRALSREAIVSRIQQPAARIEFACSEDEALAKLRRAAREGAPFHLAIIDRIRPRTDNMAMHRKIISSPDLSATRVIALMPMRWTLDEAAKSEFGASAFVSKPLRRANLLAAIEAALRSQKAIVHGTNAATASAGAAPEQNLAARALAGLKVLVAEDNPVNQEVALSYLAGFGCDASLANNGLEAIHAYETTRFDVVLMDCQMPEVDGLAAIRHIRARETSLGQPRTPIVMVTANAFTSDREQAFAAGADGFLTKPFNEAQLIRAMESCATRIAA